MTVSAIGAPPVLHADDCTGTCGLWLAAGTPSCQPYPCQCRSTRENAPDWARRQGQARCFWQKRGLEGTPGGGYRSRCPCWGTDRTGKPGDCCAHHSANPRYAVAPVGVADPDLPPFEIPTEPAGWHAPHERNEPEPDEHEYDWPDEIREPYVRRWSREELTCECVLAYANDKRSVATHCVSCCNDFANVRTAAVHRRLWTQPCRDPWKIVDCDTGRALLYQDGDGIWRDSYPSAA